MEKTKGCRVRPKSQAIAGEYITTTVPDSEILKALVDLRGSNHDLRNQCQAFVLKISDLENELEDARAKIRALQTRVTNNA